MAVRHTQSDGSRVVSVPMKHGRTPPTRWWPWVIAWTVLGLGIRLETVLSNPHKLAQGDAYFYHYTAHLFVSGHGFINPIAFFGHQAHDVIPTASFPPLFIFLVAIPAAIGLKSFFIERIFCCILGAAGVLVGGMAGREIAGRRVGLIAAFLLAVYPNIWMSDQLALSETIAPLLVALVLLTTYRFWKVPSVRRALWMGATLGVAILGRDELVLLSVFIIVPMTLAVVRKGWKQRIGLLAAAAAAVVLVLTPWIGYNLTRFEKPVFVSTGLGVTLASANCAWTYSGEGEGYWYMPCALDYANHPSLTGITDESLRDPILQDLATTWIAKHSDRIVPVAFAKVGRAFGFFHPMQQIRYDFFIETRPYKWTVVGLGMYYCLLALSVGGTVILRRRRIPSFPMWALALDVLCAALLSFGNTRYRTSFEVGLVIMAAVQLQWIWGRLSGSVTIEPSPFLTSEKGDRSSSEASSFVEAGEGAP